MELCLVNLALCGLNVPEEPGHDRSTVRLANGAQERLFSDARSPPCLPCRSLCRSHWRRRRSWHPRQRGYEGTVEVPTIDVISTERNVIGNLVGTYNDLEELMVLTAGGKVTLHTSTYPPAR